MNTKSIWALLLTIAIIVSASNISANEHPEGSPMKIDSTFPLGEKLPERFSQYFTGQAYLAPVATNKTLNTPVSNVTFEPGCRNNWHKHSGGQLLLVIDGEGLYQERGKLAKLLKRGDSVEILPNVEHWHGATATSFFAHLAVETNSGKNQNTWLEPVDEQTYAVAQPLSSPRPRLTDAAIRNHSEFLPNLNSTFKLTDPELIETFDNFAFDDIYNQTPLIDLKMRFRLILISLIATGSSTEYRLVLEGALSNGIPPEEVKEIIYQAIPYLGIGKVLDCMVATNEIFQSRKIALPLPSGSTTNRSNRFAKGIAAQKAIFGERIDAMRKNSPPDLLHMQDNLTAHCFGDTYTRKHLDLKTRELLTFAMLISLGDCESQVKGHVAGNHNIGNDRTLLIQATTALLPYIGYPRTLNALNCINEVIPPAKAK